MACRAGRKRFRLVPATPRRASDRPWKSRSAPAVRPHRRGWLAHLLTLGEWAKSGPKVGRTTGRRPWRQPSSTSKPAWAGQARARPARSPGMAASRWRLVSPPSKSGTRLPRRRSPSSAMSPRWGAPIQRRGLQDRRPAAVRGGGTRELEGQACRGERSGRGDGAGAAGGILSLVAPIPPATISFHGAATVHPAGSPEVRSAWKELASLVPAERRASASVIEVVPEDSGYARIATGRQGRGWWRPPPACPG